MVSDFFSKSDFERNLMSSKHIPRVSQHLAYGFFAALGLRVLGAKNPGEVAFVDPGKWGSQRALVRMGDRFCCVLVARYDTLGYFEVTLV